MLSAKQAKKLQNPRQVTSSFWLLGELFFAAIDLPRVYGSESLDVTDFLGRVRCRNYRIHLPTMRGRQIAPHGG